MENEKIDVNYFKGKLEEGREKLLKQLGTVGRVNPDNKKDWEAVPGEKDDDTADKNDFADSIEEYEENTAILKQLESELKEVDDALKKIEDGKYGICEVCGKQIGAERLEANPSARTCVEHIK